MVTHVDDKDDFEEEFEFDLDEEFEADEPAASGKAAPASKPAGGSKNKAPVIIGGLAAIGVAGFFGYKFLMSADSEDIGNLTQAPPVVEQPTQPIAVDTPIDDPLSVTDQSGSSALDQQLDSLSQLSDSQPPADDLMDIQVGSSQINQAVSEATDDIEKSIAGLKKELTGLVETNKKMANIEKDLELTANKIVNVDKSLTNLKQDINQLTRIVKSLTEQVNDLQSLKSQRQAARAEQARQAGSRSSRSSEPKNYVSDNMTIHAIIPGRAWLRTQGGKTISITEGDMLGEYGKVLKIDAPTGSVITSSGVTIR